MRQPYQENRLSQDVARVSAQLDHTAQNRIVFNGEVAVLIIDAQKKYCDPLGERGNEDTHRACKNIQKLAPVFRAVGLPLYPVYYSHREKDSADVDFHEFTPAEQDTLLRKHTNSAFQSGLTGEVLEQDCRRLLMICGFNTSACLKSTVIDARKHGYDVCLLTDMSANDEENPANPWEALADMRKAGVIMLESEKLLPVLTETAHETYANAQILKQKLAVHA